MCSENSCTNIIILAQAILGSMGEDGAAGWGLFPVPWQPQARHQQEARLGYTPTFTLSLETRRPNVARRNASEELVYDDRRVMHIFGADASTRHFVGAGVAAGWLGVDGWYRRVDGNNIF